MQPAKDAVGWEIAAKPDDPLPEADSFPINSPEGPRVLGGTGPPRFCRQLGGTSHSTTEKGYARLAGGPITLGAMPKVPLGIGYGIRCWSSSSLGTPASPTLEGLS